eukprot:1370827-Prymnesium_polylepis.1
MFRVIASKLNLGRGVRCSKSRHARAVTRNAERGYELENRYGTRSKKKKKKNSARMPGVGLSVLIVFFFFFFTLEQHTRSAKPNPHTP